MRTLFPLHLAIVLFLLNFFQESVCFPVLTKARLEKRATKIVSDVARFRAVAMKAQAGLYKGVSKFSYATGAGKVGAFFDKAAKSKTNKVQILDHAAQTKARDMTISI